MDTKTKESYIKALLREKNEVFVAAPNSRSEDESYPVVDLKKAKTITKASYFSMSNPHHAQIAKELMTTLVDIDGVERFFEAAIYCKRVLNEQLFIYVFSIVVLHREDTRSVCYPSPVHTCPFRFIKWSEEPAVREKAAANWGDMLEVLNIPLELNKECDESCLTYFREDIGLSVFYLLWNLMHPCDGPASIAKKDRRGELFYYVHKQILARYNMERMCNLLGPLPPNYDLINKSVDSPYFSKLKTSITGLTIPGRCRGTKVEELFRPEERLLISALDLRMMADSILEAIYARYIVDTNWQVYQLDEKTGIDVLGHLLEATSDSKNLNVYGNLFNLLKMFFGFSHDPIGENKEGPSVLSCPSTALRDPAMYYIINLAVNICERHKNQLPPYDRTLQLDFSGIKLDSIQVQTDESSTPNTFLTYISTARTKLARLNPDYVPVVVKHRRLKYNPFTITMKVTNSGSERAGTLRIFMLPVQDVLGINYDFFAMRSFAIEIDRIPLTVPNGQSTITRYWNDSNLTMHMDNILNDTSGLAGEKGIYGWPSNLLIPRGNENGYPVHLFAMISNAEYDKVPGAENQSILFNQRGPYNDKRAMGFPFDRRPGNNVTTLDSFLTPNMRTVQCTIRHIRGTFSDEDRPSF